MQALMSDSWPAALASLFSGLPLLFLETWMLIILIVIGVVLIGVFILKKLIKLAIIVGIVVLIVIGIRAVMGG